MTCTASSLAGLCLRDGHDLQALGSSLAAVGPCLDKAGVHHIPHPGYRHRGLSYIGGQYDLHSSYRIGQDDLHSSYIGGQYDLHISAIPMPHLLVMVHCRERQRSFNHTVQYVKADKIFGLFQMHVFVSFWLSKDCPRLYIANEVRVVLCRLAYQQL